MSRKTQMIFQKILDHKLQSKQDKTKSSKGESSLISSSSSKTESSFEVVKKDSVQNINDSDTGEHMFEKASLVSKEELQRGSSRATFARISFVWAPDLILMNHLKMNIHEDVLQFVVRLKI
ncbi:hypothetical protein AVEN_156160-1 [Araneus ventricosus]|uniref:Uncharacterized protein n=1 Tax=Araneus ventricosus TaxID=182803 RepID=A0A4Y2RTE5_ARAVE|nr:hypothetical protein AVEN_156160-1 [Araneus ventricosus]